MTTTALVIALVAGLRKQIPQIDGPWVILASLVAACAVAGIAGPTDWIDWARAAGAAWIGAVGGVSMAQQLLSKRL